MIAILLALTLGELPPMSDREFEERMRECVENYAPDSKEFEDCVGELVKDSQGESK